MAGRAALLRNPLAVLLPLLQEYLSSQQAPTWDWARWQGLAREEGLLGLLSTRCLAPEARDFAKSEFTRQSNYLYELTKIDTELAAAGLQAVLLKGYALLDHYQEQVLVRGVRDIDLLVRPGQKRLVQEALRLDAALDRWLPGGHRLNLDLTEDLVGAGRIRARARVYRFAETQVWQRSLAWNSTSQSLRKLDPVYNFLHLSIHALKHGYSRLIWLLDLALVLPTLNPDEVRQAADETGTLRPAALAAELVWRTSGHDSPLRSGLNRWELASVGHMLERRFPAEAGELLCLFSAPTWRARLALLGEFVLLRPEVVRAQYGGTLLQAYRARIRHILQLLWQRLP